jgi:two-component system phosphate regulon response regulator OmpR
MSTRILMIEDDSELAAMVGEYLEQNSLECVARGDGRSGLETLERGDFSALILDLMLPDLDGFEICRRVRERSSIPILMLTARGDETDRIVGLEIGADDYLPKPFNPRELLARLRAIMRRARPADAGGGQLLRFGRLEIDPDARDIRIDGEHRELTGYQFDLLWALATNAGRVQSRDQLMQHLQGRDIQVFDRSIDTHVSRIRAAIEDDPRHPARLLTVRGTGYVFARHQDRPGER